jgi:hypothetical protein
MRSLLCLLILLNVVNFGNAFLINCIPQVATGAYCDVCPAGYKGYQKNSNPESCRSCAEGEYSLANGRSCTMCTQGTWAYKTNITHPSDSVAACQNCPVGSWGHNVMINSPELCRSCLPGQYKDIAGSQTACTACLAGTYQPLSRQASCIGCSRGTYSATVGASDISTCINCPTGKTNSGGGTSIESCVDIRCETPQQNDAFLDLLVIKPPVGINIFSQYNARTVPDARGFDYDVAVIPSVDPSIVEKPFPTGTNAFGYASNTGSLSATMSQTGTTCCNANYAISFSSVNNLIQYIPWMVFAANQPEGIWKRGYSDNLYYKTTWLINDYRGDWILFKSTMCFSAISSEIVEAYSSSKTVGAPNQYRIYARNKDNDPWTIVLDVLTWTTGRIELDSLNGLCYRQYALIAKNLKHDYLSYNMMIKEWKLTGLYMTNEPDVVTTTVPLFNAVNPVAAVFGVAGLTFPTLPATHTVCSTMRYKDTNTLVTTDWTISCYTNGIVGASRYVIDQVDSGGSVVSSPYNMLADREYTIHSIFTWDRTLSNRDMKVVTAAMRRELGGVPTSQTTAVIPITNLNNYKVRLLDTVAVSPLRLSSYCAVCPLGTWVNTDGDCQNCPAGSSSTTVNARDASACIGCPAGSYSATDGAVCTGCPAGKYGTTVGATSCTESCPAGTYSATIGASDDSTCLNCSSGSYSSDGSATCTSCSAGKSSATVAATSINTCIACTAGTYSGLRAATCSNCPIGSYSSVVGATSIGICTNCVAGKYGITLGAVDSGTCTKCIIGTYSTTVRASSNATCINCPESTFGTADGLSSPAQCTNCPAGTTSEPGSYVSSTP